MWKSKNGLLDQKIWPIEFGGFFTFERKKEEKIEGLGILEVLQYRQSTGLGHVIYRRIKKHGIRRFR